MDKFVSLDRCRECKRYICLEGAPIGMGRQGRLRFIDMD